MLTSSTFAFILYLKGAGHSAGLSPKEQGSFILRGSSSTNKQIITKMEKN